jgi:hypothetical protein
MQRKIVTGFMRRILKWALVMLLLLTATFAAEHFRNSLQRGDREGWWEGSDSAKTIREAPIRVAEVPMWTNHPGMDKDAFTFARVRYTRLTEGGKVWWHGGYWYSDSPDSDLNLSWRLQQLTSLKTDPNGRIVDLSDKELFDYPFIYMVEPGLMTLEEEEVPALRKYLENGGFLMADDFWGEAQWNNFAREMKRVFPDKTFSDLETNHPLFSIVFPLARPLEELQVPNVMIGRQAERTQQTWEIHENAEGQRVPCRDVHYRALYDNKGRLMVFAAYNTDLGDGWEREGEDEYFFRRFAEGISYPMAINVIFYAMTH